MLVDAVLGMASYVNLGYKIQLIVMYSCFTNVSLTRKHSNRIRTARFLTGTRSIPYICGVCPTPLDEDPP